jgi:hypothetical protein
MLKYSKILFVSIALLFINGCEQKVQNKTEVAKEDQERAALIETGAVTDGAILYNKELRNHCKISGYSLARKNSKQQWKILAQNGKLAQEIKKICPSINYNHNWTPDLYEFLHKNATATTATLYSTEYQASYQQQ